MQKYESVMTRMGHEGWRGILNFPFGYAFR